MSIISQLASAPQESPEVYCDHKTVSLPRLRKTANNTFQLRRQCLVCGEPVGNPVSKLTAIRDNHNNTPLDFDETLFKSGEEKREKYWKQRRLERDRQREQYKQAYYEYLNSDEWRERRLLVLKRCGYVCEGCLMRPALHIHHLTYANVGDELLYQLVGLCEGCHDKAHAHHKAQES